MKLIKPPKLELYTFLLSIPFSFIAFNLIFFGDRLWYEPKIWVVSFSFFFPMAALSFYGHELYGNWVERKYPSLQQSRQRIFLKLLIPVLVMGPTVASILFVYDKFHILGYRLNTAHILPAIKIGISINLIFETLYEADYILSCLKQSREEKKIAERLAINQEFDALKNQVNPHFLFNCFNTLSSLITVDKEKAEQFLNEMSKVYRYLLRNNEEGLSTVENEIKFIQSYFQLLQTRHGDAVKMNIKIDKHYETYLIPSLTLQLLVENVVKHNALSKNKPLIIDIFTAAGNKLVMSNNLQRLTVKAPSNKVGLNNISEKYQLLKQPGFQVIEDDKNFIVVLPLIWSQSIAANTAFTTAVK
jgi:two-component system, LytTR family, sensor kinase